MGSEMCIRDSPIHGACGVWGCLAVGLFAKKKFLSNENYGLVLGGGGDLIGVQITGVLAIAAWTSVTLGVFFFILRKLGLLRISGRRRWKASTRASTEAPPTTWRRGGCIDRSIVRVRVRSRRIASSRASSMKRASRVMYSCELPVILCIFCDYSMWVRIRYSTMCVRARVARRFHRTEAETSY